MKSVREAVNPDFIPLTIYNKALCGPYNQVSESIWVKLNFLYQNIRTQIKEEAIEKTQGIEV